ncbi:MAG: hypothetical protein M1396_01815 [Chloroflexi bacterium]|nr:hypothetical protein [Chloroflexota bacterium]
MAACHLLACQHTRTYYIPHRWRHPGHVRHRTHAPHHRLLSTPPDRRLSSACKSHPASPHSHHRALAALIIALRILLVTILLLGAIAAIPPVLFGH